MKKIIKRGTKQIGTCAVCGCVFEFEEEDIEYIENGLFHKGIKAGFKKYVRCPQCENGVLLKPTEKTRCQPGSSDWLYEA